MTVNLDLLSIERFLMGNDILYNALSISFLVCLILIEFEMELGFRKRVQIFE